MVYIKGAVLLSSIRDNTRDTVFYKILKPYFKKCEFKNAKTSDFIDIVESITGGNWDNFFNKWLLNI